MLLNEWTKHGGSRSDKKGNQLRSEFADALIVHAGGFVCLVIPDDLFGFLVFGVGPGGGGDEMEGGRGHSTEMNG